MLPNKISTVIMDFRTDIASVSSHTLSVGNLKHPFNLVFWGEPTRTSIGGKKRSNIRGFDAGLSFTWEDVRNQETAIINFLDDLVTYAQSTTVRLRFNAQGDTNYLWLVANQGEYNQEYIHQIKRTPTSIAFELEDIQSDVSYV